MSTIRIAVASTPLTTTLADAVRAAIAAIEAAAGMGARIVCLPEAGLPGHRVQARAVPAVSQEELDGALAKVGQAAARADIAAIVGTERLTDRGREILAVVFDADGMRLGEQSKTQIDPTEERDYIAGSGRRLFRAAGLTFGIAICHEAFRYPEIVRSLVLGGAQLIFVPHFVTTDDGELPERWGDPANPYNEKAVLMRALENSVYVAAANVAGPDQGSISAVIAPDGSLVAHVEYGRVGVAVADIELEWADRSLALRWAPDRNVLGPGLSSRPVRP